MNYEEHMELINKLKDWKVRIDCQVEELTNWGGMAGDVRKVVDQLNQNSETLESTIKYIEGWASIIAPLEYDET